MLWTVALSEPRAYGYPMRTITTADRELLLEISPCDEDELDTFAAGDCWKLAYELQLRGVGRLIGVVDSEDADHWCHMAVELPDGTFLDAYGTQNRDQLIARWNRWVHTGRAVVARYDLSNPTRWDELTCDQEKEYSSPEDVAAVADKLIGWLEEL